MREIYALGLMTLIVALGALRGENYPQAEISNGAIRAKLNLPDAQKGYYRGTRFDWSGVIASLEYKGHSYFAPFYEKFDVNVHDVDLKNGVVAGPISAISGPVDEFSGADSAAHGYAEAKAGGTFVKIGVGVLRKPDEPGYDRFKMYDIIDPGRWTVRKAPDEIEFTQEVNDASSGYGYIYRKTVRLLKGKPEMLLKHTLTNTGSKAIEGSVYNHNFFVIDHQPPGPDFVIRFPFPVKATHAMPGAAEARGNEIQYLKVLQNGETAATPLEGFGNSAKDNDITVENRKTGVGVRVIGDTPLSRIYFWSVKTTLCPEAYINLNIQPKRQAEWSLTYRFYTVGDVR